jgi:hypothetical protein
VRELLVGLTGLIVVIALVAASVFWADPKRGEVAKSGRADGTEGRDHGLR